MGEYQHSVDAKGRLIVPAKFREALGETFVVTRGLDNCLFGYPMNEWRKLEEKLKGLPMTKKIHEHLRGFSFWSNRGRDRQAGAHQYPNYPYASCASSKRMCGAGCFKSNRDLG